MKRGNNLASATQPRGALSVETVFGRGDAERKTPGRCSSGATVAESLRPFFGYYGGKWRDAPRHYPPPAHGTIVEPFAGSAGYSLRYPSRNVILVERDAVIAAVWRYLIKVREREILQIADVAPHGSVDDLRCSEEAKWLVGFWLNRGVERPRRTPSKWMREGIRPGSFWGPAVRDRIARQLSKIRHWRIVEGNYSLSGFRGAATWFIDPPYQNAGQHYYHGADALDYDKLGEWCKRRRGQVIVCENEGADWLDFVSLAKVKTTRKGQRSGEVVWMMPSVELPARSKNSRPRLVRWA